MTSPGSNQETSNQSKSRAGLAPNTVRERFAYFSALAELHEQLLNDELADLPEQPLNEQLDNTMPSSGECAEMETRLSSAVLRELSGNFETLVQYSSSAAEMTMTILDVVDLPQVCDLIAKFAENTLSEPEQQKFHCLPNERRKLEWLSGRMAAKDAVRRLVRSQGGALLSAPAVVIDCQENGRPLVASATLAVLVSVSIAHKEGTTVAVACQSHKGIGSTSIGVDIEPVKTREPGFERLACTAVEVAQLGKCAPDQRDSLLTRFWCAKEAVGKALGNGLSNNPKSLEVERLIGDLTNGGRFAVRARGTTGPEYAAHCLIMPKKILAISWLEVVQ